MAQIKLAYIGGGSSRGAGTMASFAEQGGNFEGSEVVLIDLDAERLELVRELAERLMRARDLDITVTATTDRRAGLRDCDAVLSSYRPGGFEARVLDERIPLTYDVIGQETQGPGGFFMALRSIAAMKPMLDDIEYSCPDATIFNYTNPVNIVSQAVSDHSDIPIISFCEGPIEAPRDLATSVGLDPDKLDVASVGLNHGSWSVRQTYDGQPLIPMLQEIWAAEVKNPTLTGKSRRALQLTATMGSIPSEYFQYYYFEREVLEAFHAKPTTRAEDILAELPSYWSHYAEQAKSDAPVLDPARSRGGIHELELALDCMDAVYNDRDEIMTVNVANQGTVAALPDNMVIETLGQCGASGVTPLQLPEIPTHVLGLVESLAYYQQAAADAAWDGGVREATRALASHPLVRSMDVAERLYAEMAIAHRDHLPDRLVPS